MVAGKKNSTPSGRVLGHSKRVLPRLRFILLAAAFVFPLYAGKVQAVVSGGSESDGPLQIALEVLGAGTSSNAGDSSDSLPTVRVRDQYTSLHNKVTHIFLRQEVGGLEVFGEDISIGISSPGEVLNLDNRVRKYTVPALAARQLFLSPQAALRAAAAHLGLRDPGDPRILNELGGIEQAVLFEGGTLSNGSIPLKLMVQPDGTGGLYTVWNMHFETKNGIHWWHVNIDAVTGEVRFENDWSWRASYRVVGLPHSSPEDGVVSLHVDVHDPVASPFGWHDTNGIVGSEYTDTRGNNVFAQLDANGDNYADFRPDGGSLLSFDYSPDFSADPAQSSSSSVVNLFYMNNLLHDIHYHYGFTEVAGNFQVNNYNRGGVGGDPLQADAQDGSAFNNASMLTPPDGFDPRMQAHIWLHGGETLMVHSPPSLARDYQFGVAKFGARLDGSGVSGLVVQALDPPDPPLYSTTDACAPITNGLELAGNIALIDRGECAFVEKVLHVQNAGAVAALIVNHEGDHLVTMAGEEPEIVIPALFLGQSDGDAIRAAITSGTPVMATITVSTALDGAFDNEIIIHEYGHGISTRLTGGPSNSDCLHAAQSEGMGEGWSDWWALVLTAESNDVSDAPRPIGTYANGGANIRLHPYSTDMAVNPWTYDDLNTLSEEHDIGEVWCAVLWDLYWLLVEKHGFDPDVYSGTGGNNAALQLVMDGLKLQPCNPSFLGGRDAILLADVVNNGGENTCEIWEAFARRGMGEDAEDGGSATSTAVTAGFSTPSSCLPQLEFTVSAATGWGRGTITPSGNIVTSEGQSLTFTAEPFAGYVVLRWLLDGRTVQTGGETYTLPSIDADHNVSVYFSLVPTRIIRLTGYLSFGDVEVGSSAQRRLILHNDGNSSLNVSGITYPAGFSGDWSGSIAPGSAQDVIVTFNPTEAQAYGGTVTVTSDRTSGTETASMAGNVTVDNHAPQILEGRSVYVAMSEDGNPVPFELTLHASDADGDPVYWEVMDLPGHGSISIPASSVSEFHVNYAVESDFSGSDDFTIQVHDGRGLTDNIAVHVEVSPIPDIRSMAITPRGFEISWDGVVGNYYDVLGGIDLASGMSAVANSIQGQEPLCVYTASINTAVNAMNFSIRQISGTGIDLAEVPAGMVLIPAGDFVMGLQSGGGGPWSTDLPIHTNTLSAFYLDQFEVTKALWDEVRSYADANGYSFTFSGSSQGPLHPVYSVNWYDMVKWCNARSEKDGLTPVYYTDAAQTNVYRNSPACTFCTGGIDLGNDFVKWSANGYRLPTEAEWEKAARGNLVGNMYPWGNSIGGGDANYYNSGDPFDNGTSPVGYYDGNQTPVGPDRANGYGLYDMAGNLYEMCWDRWDSEYYWVSPPIDPRGPTSDIYRVYRGGSSYNRTDSLGCSSRGFRHPAAGGHEVGFRTARGS